MQRVLNLTSLSMRRSTEIVWIPNIWKFLLHSFFKLWNLFSALSFVFRTKVLHLGFMHAACNWMRAGANWESQINKGIVGKAELTVCCYCSKTAGLFVCYSYFPQAASLNRSKTNKQDQEVLLQSPVRVTWPPAALNSATWCRTARQPVVSHPSVESVSASEIPCKNRRRLWLAPQTAKRKQFIIQKLNSNELPKCIEALKHRLPLSKLATRRLFPIECWRKKVRFLLLNVRGGGCSRSSSCIIHSSAPARTRHPSWHKTETFLQPPPLWVSTRSLGNWQA